MVDEARIGEAVVQILEAIGEDPEREGLRGTPRRVARMYAEILSGIGGDPRSALDTIFQEDGEHEGVVVVREVTFYSLCEHHMLPFFGRAHMGYVPDGRIVGASKLARALEVVARRPQMQERLTAQLADAIYDVLRPDGAGVVVEAEHLCMSMRGVGKEGSLILTTATRGEFAKGVTTRRELVELLQRGSR